VAGGNEWQPTQHTVERCRLRIQGALDRCGWMLIKKPGTEPCWDELNKELSVTIETERYEAAMKEKDIGRAEGRGTACPRG
jgi:hypothetical protein